ncbi:MAG: hypothetical protein GEV05_24310 [Betaproteobacteria bacterium]|nr:hypothetical protein [Betaproteobacteria bacterium]
MRGHGLRKSNKISHVVVDMFCALFYGVWMKLTDRHRKIIAFLKAFRAKHGVRPSYREIMVGVGLKSTAPVDYALKSLAAKGAIELVYGPDNKQVRDIVVVAGKSKRAREAKR